MQVVMAVREGKRPERPTRLVSAQSGLQEVTDSSYFGGRMSIGENEERAVGGVGVDYIHGGGTSKAVGGTEEMMCEELWKLVSWCWEQLAELRPDMESVIDEVMLV